MQKTNFQVLDFDFICGKIQHFINHLKKCEKFFIDFSGKGEPTLQLELILKLNSYIKTISNTIKREILVMFVSNGLELSKSVAKTLQDAGILFGISIDGSRSNHDLFRVDAFGNPTYDRIIQNVMSFDDRTYVGCAISITHNVFPLLETILELHKLFNTISVKPVRGYFSFSSDNIIDRLREYDRLALHIIQCLDRNDCDLLFCLLNGDDYFGKFLYRCFSGNRVLYRCDAGINRIVLNNDGIFYECPAFCSNNGLIGENLDVLNDARCNEKCKKQSASINCKKCSFYLFCGGECPVVFASNNSKVNVYMCAYKKHLILLAMYIQQYVGFSSPTLYKKIKEFCEKIDSRFQLDKELDNFLSLNPNLSFLEAKLIFDNKRRKKC